MALQPNSMTRSSSSDSSALSNIMVTGVAEDDSVSDQASASTPQTSLNDNASLQSAKGAFDTLDVIQEETGRRPKRARSNVSTYNVKELFDAQQQPGSSRNVSGLTGRTLVDQDALRGDKDDKDVEEMEWEATNTTQRRSPRSAAKMHRRPSVKDRMKKAASKVGSVLGKRSREVMEAGKRKFGMSEVEESPKASKVLKELDMGTKGVLDEMDLSDDEYDTPPPRPVKRAKTTGKAPAEELTVPTAPPLKITSGRQAKKWQKEGLFVGQDADADPTQKGGRKKLQKKRPGSSGSDDAEVSGASKRRPLMPLPMFDYLDKSRDFIIPFDIYAPSFVKGDEKPKDWFKLNRNRIIGEAKDLWEKAEKLPASACVCQPPAPGEKGCEDDCLNRVMQYECNEDNCNLEAGECSNRAFAELASRTKKGGSFDCGVEVIKAGNRGFGVRSCRTFSPGQIIMEYTGEIISETESQRRVKEEYKDKQNYYLMELERGLIIDGTKGSMARFVNHSCAPNCEVRMMKVNGTPRMAVFAGDNGIMTGDELTYDYNFDSLGIPQACYCGAATCRGYLIKRLNAAEQKKQAREEMERKRKAAEEAQKNAESEARKKRLQNDRGSGWRGWVAVDDPETKERLKAEKREREEAEKNSSRAQRLAARRGSLPAAATKPAVEKRTNSKRRKTVHVDEENAETELEEAAGESAADALVQNTANPTTHTRTVSRGSKFTEELPRPSSAQTHTSKIVKKTEVSVSTTEVHEETRMISEDAGAANAEDEEPPRPNDSSKHTLSRTASKGKEVMKSVGQAVKKGLKGGDKGATRRANGQLRQSSIDGQGVGRASVGEAAEAVVLGSDFLRGDK
ncbi:hypothetical protein LTR37_009410 [Vermiconidia calcicola]|uniref:Uncharacterized protein n=1 Tax=Vermiconidia calcicola TaxID=1690605 RepID=A0ACC3N9K5_9PEZI|nr:hypothetical protein LTR37_009410 [Vermiconidia calcicola]